MLCRSFGSCALAALLGWDAADRHFPAHAYHPYRRVRARPHRADGGHGPCQYRHGPQTNRDGQRGCRLANTSTYQDAQLDAMQIIVPPIRPSEKRALDSRGYSSKAAPVRACTAYQAGGCIEDSQPSDAFIPSFPTSTYIVCASRHAKSRSRRLSEKLGAAAEMGAIATLGS